MRSTLIEIKNNYPKLFKIISKILKKLIKLFSENKENFNKNKKFLAKIYHFLGHFLEKNP